MYIVNEYRSFCLVAQLCPTPCDPMDCCMPGFPVLHYLLEFAQTHVHWVSDTTNHLVLCCPLLLPPSIFPNIRVFLMSQLFPSGGQSTEASASVLPINIQDWFSLGWTGLVSLLSKELSRVFSSTAIQKHQFFCTQPSLWSNSHMGTWLLEKLQLWSYRPLLAK